MTQEERDQLLLDLKNGQKKLFNGQDEMKKDLRSLSQTVARIEVEHGEKIQIALDVLTSHSQKFDSIENRLESIENKVDRHSHEIYYLNSKVHAF